MKRTPSAITKRVNSSLSSPATFARRIRGLLRDQVGSSDLTVALLLTAAGAAMVGLTVPSLYKSSDTAARTFDQQVQVLERGAGGRGGGVGGLGGGAGGLGGGVPGLGNLPAVTPPVFEMGTKEAQTKPAEKKP